VVAAAFQVHGQQAQPCALQVEGDVGTAPQAMLGRGKHVEADQIRVLHHGNAAAYREADALHHAVPGHDDGVAVWREYPGGNLGAVDLLERDDVGVEQNGVAAERVDVLGPLRTYVLGQRGITLASGGEPLEIPGRHPQFGGRSPAA